MAAERPPTVLMTADTVGGVWTYALDLSAALVRHGWAVHLATMGAPLSPAQRAQAAAVDGLAVHESAFRLEWMQDPWTDVDLAGRWLLRLERELRPHVVHLNQYAFGALPFGAPTLLVAHSCVLSWWRAVHGGAAPAEWNAYRDRVAAGLRGAGRVAAPTRAMLRTLRANYGYEDGGLVIANGRDAQAFMPQPKQDFIFAAGRFWDEAKNLQALEAVAPSLPWPVRVAGSCTAPDGGMRRPRGVQALGELSAAEVAAQMSRAAIYALPARYEPFGLSVLEAALSGCALVLGDIDSLREVWGDAAVYVRPDSHAALQEALEQLVTQPAAREHFAAAARLRAREFGIERMLRGTLAAYQALRHREPADLEELTCA
jgi:glycosyltransferase involved in cell wall biosynthesis